MYKGVRDSVTSEAIASPLLASGQLQLSPRYKAGSECSRAITKEACDHVVHYIEAKGLLYKCIKV